MALFTARSTGATPPVRIWFTGRITPLRCRPARKGADRDQCFSGAAFINKEGIPTFIYHGLPDGICLATSDDDMLIYWEKHPANPIIPNPQAGDEYRIAGAPCAWVEGDTYYALTGNSGAAPPDAAYLFTSTDLSHWEYLHPFYEGGRSHRVGRGLRLSRLFPVWATNMYCPSPVTRAGRNSTSARTPTTDSPQNATSD